MNGMESVDEIRVRKWFVSLQHVTLQCLYSVIYISQVLFPCEFIFVVSSLCYDSVVEIVKCALLGYLS